jgi:hypothetical protein
MDLMGISVLIVRLMTPFILSPSSRFKIFTMPKVYCINTKKTVKKPILQNDTVKANNFVIIINTMHAEVGGPLISSANR